MALLVASKVRVCERADLQIGSQLGESEPASQQPLLAGWLAQPKPEPAARADCSGSLRRRRAGSALVPAGSLAGPHGAPLALGLANNQVEPSSFIRESGGRPSRTLDRARPMEPGNGARRSERSGGGANDAEDAQMEPSRPPEGSAPVRAAARNGADAGPTLSWQVPFRGVQGSRLCGRRRRRGLNWVCAPFVLPARASRRRAASEFAQTRTQGSGALRDCHSHQTGDSARLDSTRLPISRGWPRDSRVARRRFHGERRSASPVGSVENSNEHSTTQRPSS